MALKLQELQYSESSLLVSLVDLVPTLVWWIVTIILLAVQVFMIVKGIPIVIYIRVDCHFNIWRGERARNPWVALFGAFCSFLSVVVCPLYVFITVYLEYIEYYGGSLHDIYLRRLIAFIVGTAGAIFHFTDLKWIFVDDGLYELTGWRIKFIR